METWKAVVDSRKVAELVAGLFERLGIVVSDTGEKFTCVHRPDRIDLEAGVDSGRVDYSVEVASTQIQRLADQTRTGELDETERFRIIRALFTPATASTLTAVPILSNPVVRRLTGAESLIHVRLRSPVSDEPDAEHTLVYAAHQWLVFPGLHGKAKRTFTLSTEQAIEYQRRVFAAVKANRLGDWLGFGRWYRAWRQAVSRPGSAL